MGEAILSALLQVGVVLALCLAVWALFARKRGFRAFVGLTATSAPALLAGAAFGLVGAVLLLQFDAVHDLAAGEHSVVGEAVRRLPPAELAGVLMVAAVLKTGFAEELLFRGLIGKRLIEAIGFNLGNAAQAFVFAAVHLLLLLIPDASDLVALIMVGFAGVSGWVNGWLNERLGRGSILPGWAAHAGGNVLSYLVLAGLVPLPS